VLLKRNSLLIRIESFLKNGDKKGHEKIGSWEKVILLTFLLDFVSIGSVAEFPLRPIEILMAFGVSDIARQLSKTLRLITRPSN
jgi:hypothetical protein